VAQEAVVTVRASAMRALWAAGPLATLVVSIAQGAWPKGYRGPSRGVISSDTGAYLPSLMSGAPAISSRKMATEERFTLTDDEAARVHLLDSIVMAVLDERSRLRIVITLRADFIDRPLQYGDFGELLRQRSELVLPLAAEDHRGVGHPLGLIQLEGHEVGARHGLWQRQDHRRRTGRAACHRCGALAGSCSWRGERACR
jgi:hypothetical protein